MITVKQIKNGKGYLKAHLSANDYYSEGEEVVGYWRGKGAQLLELEGPVDPVDLEAVRTNRHPQSGEKLTPRKLQTVFHDIGLAAPKAVSILAVVAGDERVREAFTDCVDEAIQELEKRAAVRVRSGSNYHTENVKMTGNIVTAVYIHDSSRSLDPQLHAHLVTGNVSYDHERGRWYALQPRLMLESANGEVRGQFLRSLTKRMEAMGYEVIPRADGFGIRGIGRELEQRFSRRSTQRKAFEQRYEEVFQKAPSKRRIEQFIKEGKKAATERFVDEYRLQFGKVPSTELTQQFVVDWRSSKLKKISTASVHRLQQAKLTPGEVSRLADLVNQSRSIRETKEAECTEAPAEQQRRKSQAKEVDDSKTETAQRQKESRSKPTTQGASAKDSRAPLSKRQLQRRVRQGLVVRAAFQGHPLGLVIGSLHRKARR